MQELTKLTQEQFVAFARFIYGQTGIRIQEGKITLLSNRIRRRLKHHGLGSFDDYYRLLSSSRLPGELEHFIDAVTTNETHFFRTGGHYEWFAGAFLDDLLARTAAGRHERSIRIWSAACSSGEEAYSAAICLTEARHRIMGWQTRILGTDISETMLEAARAATYTERSLEQVSPQRLKTCFTRGPGESPDTWRVRQEIASLCEFRRHNLLEPIRERPFDCIFVRNVMIYFDRESKARAVTHIVEVLAPGGFLVVGPADGIYDLLGSLEKRSIFLYQKPGG